LASKNARLVCQHLENLSRHMLEEYPEPISDFVKGRSGVYALYRRQKLYYVGLAGSLLRRLKKHLKDHHRQTWDRFSVYLTVGPQYMREVESLLIRISDPPGNKVKGKFIQSEDLKGNVRGKYRRHQREKESEMFGTGTAEGRPPKRPREKRREGGLAAALSKYVHFMGSRRLRATYKGKTYYAAVLKDGTISFGGEHYQTPTAAAKAITRRKSHNGWRFWQYQRASRDWVPLTELRG